MPDVLFFTFHSNGFLSTGNASHQAMGAHRVLCSHCACAVRNVAINDPFSPMAKVTAVITVFPDTGLLRFLPGAKPQIMS